MSLEGSPMTELCNLQQAIADIVGVQTEAKQLMECMDDKMSKINDMVESFKHALLCSEVQELYIEEDIDTEVRVEDESTITNERLSGVARDILLSIGAHGPLISDELSELLMVKLFGIPRSAVLPIIRQCTQDITGLCQQLQAVKERLNGAHMEYKEQRRLDLNFISRINRLLKNVNDELERESSDH